MIFSNIFFMFRFLSVVLLIYYIVPYKYKNAVITIASLVFYSWGEVKYFPIMIASTIVDFYSSQYIEKHRGDIKKSVYLKNIRLPRLNITLQARPRFIFFMSPRCFSIYCDE